MACIYIIKHKDSDALYVGSTFNFERSKCKHESACYNENDKHYNSKLYQFIRENGGFNNFTIENIYDLNDGELKFEKEQEYIDLYNPSLNDRRAFGFDMVEYIKQYDYMNSL